MGSKSKVVCIFQVYNPLKPTKYGVRVYSLCEVNTGFCAGFEVYTGRTDEPVDMRTFALVFCLLHSHCVYAVCAKALSANHHGRMSNNMINFSHVFTENKATLHIGKATIRMVYL